MAHFFHGTFEIDDPIQFIPVEGFNKIVNLENDQNSPPDTDAWHTDLTFKN